MAELMIDTDQVAQIATEIEQLNKNLTEELNNCKKTVDQLNKVYQGEASQATIDAFDAFATKYFQNYKDIIDQYIQFLRRDVVEGYREVIGKNITLAESFK